MQTADCALVKTCLVTIVTVRGEWCHCLCHCLGRRLKIQWQNAGSSPEAFMSFAGGLKTIVVATGLGGRSKAITFLNSCAT